MSPKLVVELLRKGAVSLLRKNSVLSRRISTGCYRASDKEETNSDSKDLQQSVNIPLDIFEVDQNDIPVEFKVDFFSELDNDKQREIVLSTEYSGFAEYQSVNLREEGWDQLIRVSKYDYVRNKERLMDHLGFEFESRLSNMRLSPIHTDILIIGGGAIGSSAAFWIKDQVRNGLQVTVIENDLNYKNVSATWAVEGLNQQYGMPEYVEMSLDGASFMRNAERFLYVETLPKPNVFFEPYGNLTLANEEKAEELINNSKMQNSMGAKNIILNPKKIRERFPWLNTEGVALGCLGLENEGWFDPYALLLGLKARAMDLGAEYTSGELVGFKYQKPKGHCIYDENHRFVHQALIKLNNGLFTEANFSLCVLAAGANSETVGKLLGAGIGEGILQIPINIRKKLRFMYRVFSPDGPGLRTPIIIDPSGFYFRREDVLGHYVVSFCPYDFLDEPPKDDQNAVSSKKFFISAWQEFLKRVPVFRNVKVKQAWAGLHESNPLDGAGLLDFHPLYRNVIMACGFNENGIQLAPAVGRSIAEIVILRRFSTINLSRFGFARIGRREPLQRLKRASSFM